ncbi:MAG TPA: ROK family protein [Acidimicrobiales bacterium]
MQTLGIDIGGTGIKGAVVDTATGEFTVERLRIDTPQPATPDAVSGVVSRITEHFAWTGPVGCTFPGVVKHGVIRTAANVDHAWIDLSAADVFAKATGCPVAVVNDADGAGEAEARFGHEQARVGVVVLLTLGTGIGSALVVDGELIPNTEFGHLKMGKKQRDAERLAAESVRESEDLGWKGWANRLSDYLRELEQLLWPDLFVLGGGVSKKADKFIPHIRCATPVVAAELLNQAGIVGAALAAERMATADVSD